MKNVRPRETRTATPARELRLHLAKAPARDRRLDFAKQAPNVPLSRLGWLNPQQYTYRNRFPGFGVAKDSKIKGQSFPS